MKVELHECPICGGILLKTEKAVAFKTPNPGEIIIETSCFECQQCGEDIFNEDQTDELAKKVDEQLLAKA